MRKHGAGVYLISTRHWNWRKWLPFRHFAYVGQTFSMSHRWEQHKLKPWADLKPRLVLFIPLPRWRWLLLTVETLLILMTWPVYNYEKNRWNPRRVSLVAQRMQRAARNRKWQR